MYLAFDWLALAVDHGFGRDDTVWRRIGLNHFELNNTHAASGHEDVALSNRPVGFQEVRLQVYIEKVPAQSIQDNNQ